MKIGLTENIETIINIERAEYTSLLEKHILKDFQAFPEQILTGELKDNRLKAKINPPIGLADPFRSLVNGTIVSIANKTELKLKISPGWIIRIFLSIWSVLNIIIVTRYEYTDFQDFVRFIGILMVSIIPPLIMSRLKVRWDRKRLERKII